VRLATGGVLHEEVERKPDLSDATSITAKFFDCARRRLPDGRAEALRVAIADLESVASIDEVLALTAAGEVAMVE
jgi:hypothetical protein